MLGNVLIPLAIAAFQLATLAGLGRSAVGWPASLRRVRGASNQ